MARAQTKKVKLTQGNFIAEFRVPTAIANANAMALTAAPDHPEEFTHLRYTAACAFPNLTLP